MVGHGLSRRVVASLLGLLVFLGVGDAAVSVSKGGVRVRQQVNAQDVVVAGGIDGRVYALNAWTGDVMWMFDTGGPMVDSSNCGMESPVASSTVRSGQSLGEDVLGPSDDWQTATLDVDGSVDASEVSADRLAVSQDVRGAGDVVIATAMDQMMPSFDGRLYHISGSSIRELEMNMVDIINANGPVRLVDDVQASGQPSLSDILLFGEKTSKLFSLDATRGIIQPYPSRSSTNEILFGRAEFKTKAVHSLNMSAARCFTISEYFLQFADQSRCSANSDSISTQRSPEILVLAPESDTAEHEDEESTIAAYDPWTHEQLWERHLPRFDVIAVYGISSSRGKTFFDWNVDGPSSLATTQKRQKDKPVLSAPERKLEGIQPALQQALGAAGKTKEDGNISKKLHTRPIARDWDSVNSQFRLRLLGGNYYLEPNDGITDNLSGSGASSSFFDEDGDHLHFTDSSMLKRKRLFWESMESDGKRGVFITYYHVGAVMFGATVSILLIAWGCYIRGFSASLAQTAMAMDSNQFRFTVGLPGQEQLSITGILPQSLLMEAGATLGFGSNSPLMLGNGESEGSASTAVSSELSVPLDAETRAAMIEKFSRMLALEAEAMLRGAKRQLQLEYDTASDATTAPSSVTVVADSPLSTGSRRPSFITPKPLESTVLDSSVSSLVVMTEDDDGKLIPVIEEIEDSSHSSAQSVESEESNTAEQSVLSTQSRDVSVPSSTRSASSSSDASQNSSGTGGSESDSESTVNSNNQFGETTSSSGSTAEHSNRRKDSNASSSSSSTPNDAEVLFPFVCQSRFTNEFLELSALGKGGFGQVMLAENRLDGRKYAIKRVGLHLKNQTSKTLQKFLREVKILALLDHPNIVRYYQAWLEKVEEGVAQSRTVSSMEASSVMTSEAQMRNYSMSNLLAPISEMEFSDNRRSLQFYSNASFGDDDGGFDWERNSSDGTEDVHPWTEEELTVPKQGRGTDRLVKQRGKRSNGSDGHGDADNHDEDSSCYSIDNCDHWLYIQMQYCAGRNLGDYLALPTRPMQLAKLFKIFTQIASAIAHVHSCGLIHRDLKPANIFVADTDGDSIKLGDFGLSRYAANVNLATQTVEEQSVSNVLMNNGHMLSTSKWSVSMSNMSESNDITAGVGTYLYASPEQVAGKKYDAKTDMYSLGMILFELCHERFTTTMERYIALRSARERNFPPEFPWRKKCPEIMEMLERLLHPDPMVRPDACEVVQWSQELYEMSLAQQSSSNLARSPIQHARSFNGSIPALNIDLAASLSSGIFSLQVEACMETSSDDNGERRLPNHNLLKEVCDVIADVSNGRIEIKKCGLHLQDGGAQVLDFVLDPHLSEQEQRQMANSGHAPETLEETRRTLVHTIQALDGVQAVRMET
ncbi:hypothetical protein Poli38472_014453 [Pythium oligandrum]|uniref:non-specific serine/threonine protein kinase n=1 Tax=Pythium oligandrum TaxID=41045 RepID=A0A8K1FIQ6_PYTOL|nr:hypothetical protein Poli38472_014453 [Pythium oligandrum]|eukprot:TMW60992.1 hypothetical protein Poli38472_014453 [Pythium oligandrum]